MKRASVAAAKKVVLDQARRTSQIGGGLRVGCSRSRLWIARRRAEEARSG